MLTPERRAFLQAAYSALLRPAEPAERAEEHPPSDGAGEQDKPKHGNDPPPAEDPGADPAPE